MTRFAKKAPRAPEEASSWDALRNSGPRKTADERAQQRSEQRRLRRQKQNSTNTVCFGCRKTGHRLQDCPAAAAAKGVGNCYRCGSNEHTSHECKTPGFKFATCFVCNEKGHLSADCPKNDHGLYPDGGECKYCGSKQHLARNCKPLRQDKGEVTVGSGDGLSADTDDALDAQKRIKLESQARKAVKKAAATTTPSAAGKKVVKF